MPKRQPRSRKSKVERAQKWFRDQKYALVGEEKLWSDRCGTVLSVLALLLLVEVLNGSTPPLPCGVFDL